MGKIYEPNLKDILSILNLKDFERTNHVISYDVQAKKISSATNFISQNNSVSFMTFICQDLKAKRSYPEDMQQCRKCKASQTRYVSVKRR
jgi:hypothetical protein